MTRLLVTMMFGACIPALAWGEPAVVHAPGDGFLALRSEPSTTQGVRLAKIPHGTRLALGECVRPTPNQRWCRASYGGQAGWVLDTYLDFVTDTAEVPNPPPEAVDPAVERAILRAMSAACTPEWCRARVAQVIGRYATVFMECRKPACENAIAYLKREGERWVLVDYGTGITSDDLLGYGFPAPVAAALAR